MSAPASENPLVAARVDSTTAITGIGLVESAVGLYNGVESGSWVEGGLGAAGAGLETLGLVLDPVGTLVSYGVAWLMEHVQPLSDALDWLAGDPDTIASYAATWRNVATAVQQAGADFGTAVNQGTAGWQGQAADAYRAHTSGQIEQLTAAGTGAQTVGSIVEGAGVLVGVVEDGVPAEGVLGAAALGSGLFGEATGPDGAGPPGLDGAARPVRDRLSRMPANNSSSRRISGMRLPSDRVSEVITSAIRSTHRAISATAEATTCGVAIPTVRPISAAHCGIRAIRVDTHSATRSRTTSRTTPTSTPAPSTIEPTVCAPVPAAVSCSICPAVCTR